MNITLSRVNQCQKAAVGRRPFASAAARMATILEQLAWQRSRATVILTPKIEIHYATRRLSQAGNPPP
jgi:hypothetical protein